MKYELTLLTKEEAELKNIKELIEFFKGKVIQEEKYCLPLMSIMP